MMICNLGHLLNRCHQHHRDYIRIIVLTVIVDIFRLVWNFIVASLNNFAVTATLNVVSVKFESLDVIFKYDFIICLKYFLERKQILVALPNSAILKIFARLL